MKKPTLTFLITIIIAMVALLACEKDEVDPRLQYTGDYHFIKAHYVWNISTGSINDTTYYDGFVQAHPDNKDWITLKIGDGQGEYFSTPLDTTGTFGHPDVEANGNPWFNGQFIGTDSIYIDWGFSAHGGGSKDEWFGRKTSK